MIQDVDETLRRMLEQELARLPDAGQLPEVQISFDAPWSAVEAGATPRVNLYLHDIREDLAQRDESFRRVRPPEAENAAISQDWAGIRQAPIRLDLCYVITVDAGGDPAVEHRLLAEVLGIFLRVPVIPEAFRVGALKGLDARSVRTTVAAADQPPHTDLTPLWQAVGARHRPAIRLVVSAPYDPFETRWTRVVREALMGVTQSAAPDAPRGAVDVTSIRVSVAGVVTNADATAPLPGAHVSIAGRDEVSATDERGFFSILNLPPGPHRLHFARRGYETVEFTVTAPPPGRPDQLKVLEVRMAALESGKRAEEEAAGAAEALNAPGMAERGRIFRVAISGRLVYEDGRPAAYVPVRSGAVQSITDADGVYTFSSPPGPEGVVATVTGLGDVEIQDSNGVGALALPAETRPAEPGRANDPRREDPGRAQAAEPRPPATAGPARRRPAPSNP